MTLEEGTRRQFLGVLSGATLATMFSGAVRAQTQVQREAFTGDFAIFQGADADKPAPEGKNRWFYFADDTQTIYFTVWDDDTWQTFGTVGGGGGGGGGYDSRVSKSSDYTASDGELVIVDASGGKVSITLPSPTDGHRVGVKKDDVSSNLVKVLQNSSESVDNNKGIELDSENELAGVESNGTDWFSTRQVGTFDYILARIIWETAADWDNAVSESGVAHESVTNTDHNDATIIKQGYQIASPFKNTNLDGYWPLHEDSGSTANDFSGNANDGTITGATLGATGLLGTTAYDFDGTDDEVAITHDAVFNPSGSFSLAAWVKHTGTSDTGENRGIVLKNFDGSVSPYILWWDDDTTPTISFRTDAGGSTTNISSSGLSDNTWYYVVAVYDSGNSNQLLYIDGSQDASASQSGTPDSNTEDVYIGHYPFAADHFAGPIADVRYYTTALSSSEVQTLYDVVNTAGSLTTDTKSFASGKNPDLTADVTMNGVTDIAVDIIGSPGTADEETQTVQVTGDGTFDPAFANKHTDFRVNPKPDNGGDVTRTPTINSLELKE